MHSCLSREGELGPSGSATDSSLFLRWLNVCFQIPKAFVTPTQSPLGPWPAFASFLPLLDQAGLQGGVPGQVSPSCCPPARARASR